MYICSLFSNGLFSKVKLSYTHTLHINMHVYYPFDKDQSNPFPCFTLFFPAFHDDVNTCMIGSLI